MISQLPQRVQLSPDVLVQELNGEAVLLDLKTERYYGLNPVGTRFWRLLGESDDVTRARELLLKEYEVDGETLDRDLGTLLEKLERAGLVTSSR